jgi:UDP-N-acetylglucosamine--N-acetylmuramyl-(pentapeptide) pyrophosphoryl-undecaprenol N-acetylglucosamine transferase
MAMANRLLLAAGGTGGHMFPAQALAETLKAQGWDIAMMTDARGEKHAGRIPADPIIEVKAASITPRKPIAAILGVFKLTKGVMQARAFIKAWQPDVVVGFGGYPAFPAMRAAQGMGVPTIIHEQNAVLGRVNRVFAAKALYVASGFEELQKLPTGANHLCTGNPLREQIINSVPQRYKAPKEGINLLIVGGSLGAKIVSETMPAAIALLPEALRKRLKVVQQTRPEYQEAAITIYKEAGVEAICETFFADIETHLAKAHYIVGRAGASSVSEMAVMGLPALLVPLKIAMDDHQTVNARSLSSLDAADILPESEFTPERVKTTLEARLNDSNWLKSASKQAKLAGRPDAAAKLAELVISAVK